MELSTLFAILVCISCLGMVVFIILNTISYKDYDLFIALTFLLGVIFLVMNIGFNLHEQRTREIQCQESGGMYLDKICVKVESVIRLEEI